VKVNWALDAPIPWRDSGARRAGTVHFGGTRDELRQTALDLARGREARPFVLLGQMTTADPSRSPAGTEVAWAYTHLPDGSPADLASAAIETVRRIEEQLEDLAPGFGALVRTRLVQPPGTGDLDVSAGAVNGGTSVLSQQLVFRPVAGLGRAETPVDGLYLGSASAHPGGGVHGACGANAARAALSRERLSGPVRRRLVDGVWRGLYR
jgi:phytoene dehydrogenase-like protein